MLSRWPIRYKLGLGVVTLFLIVSALSFSGFRGVYAYRQLARTISHRAEELPAAAKLTQNVAELRASLGRVRRLRNFPSATDSQTFGLLREEFRTHLLAVKAALEDYAKRLDTTESEDSRIGDRRAERDAVRKIELTLATIEDNNRAEDWMLDEISVGILDEQVDEVHRQANELPTHLHTRMHVFADQVRGEYRTWIIVTWISSVTAGVMLMFLLLFFNRWIFQPLKVLIEGSRRVAGGEFAHRIRLNTRDEVADLASAMDEMTSRFQEIRDDLDSQVKLRTKEVVQSERLASVGFLAAGVAHEINNPMASIAMSAESLESRVHELLPSENELTEAERQDVEIVYKYLRRIQEEAFRCKGITEKLLDFSRMGDVERQHTDMHELTEGVIDMVRHLGSYRNKRIECEFDDHVSASVNSQEIKQVVLNLITNALDSLDANGVVRVRLRRNEDDQQVELTVSDNGCGMSKEVLEHLFEPFFTRRRDGQGTGLGLSITYRIIQDHGGQIAASSEGPGRGSEFRVTLPLAMSRDIHERKQQAA